MSVDVAFPSASDRLACARGCGPLGGGRCHCAEVRCLGTVLCPLCAGRCVLFAVRWSEARADAVLGKLPKGSVFVNVGRGDLIRSGECGETFAL